MTLSSAFLLAKPLVIGRAVDALATATSRRALVGLGIAYVLIAIGRGTFLFLQRWCIIVASREIEYDMRGDFYDHLQKLPPTFYEKHRVGDLMSRATNDLSNARMLIGPAIMHSMSSVLIVTGSFFMMFRIDAALALVTLVAFPFIAGIVKVYGQQLHDRSKEVQDYVGELSARVQESISGVRVVRAFSQEENQKRTFRLMNRELVDRNRKLIRQTAMMHPLLEMIIGVLYVSVFFLGSRRILSGELTLGSFVAFQFYLGRMVWPLIAFGWVINLFQRGMASMGRLNEIWNELPPAEPSRAGLKPSGFGIRIRDLSFAYGETRTLNGIDLDVEPGETLGIVGRTGSGKSTLVALLSRLYDAPPGTIFLDGRAIEEIPRTELRERIGVVPQETFLFSDSIAENIRFGRGGASDDDVERMADLAGLTGDLGSFPKGIETIVGERGITLSGGQKQRTAIARAVIRNPSILLLDDCLSAVDTQTEEKILASLRKVREGRTVVIVSHRISSVKDADQIVVMDEGRIIERGSHDDLVEQDGYYAALHRRQSLEEEIEEIA